MVVNHERYPGHRPWTVIDLGDSGVTPADPEIIRAFQAGATSDASAETFDPVRDGIRLLEAQRRSEIAGGFVQLTTVTQDLDSVERSRRLPLSRPCQSGCPAMNTTPARTSKAPTSTSVVPASARPTVIIHRKNTAA